VRRPAEPGFAGRERAAGQGGEEGHLEPARKVQPQRAGEDEERAEQDSEPAADAARDRPHDNADPERDHED
jgi:hypothetical protein